MNGPQHYAEAERLLDLLAIGSDDPRDPICAAAAQAHATLALAAATVDAANRMTWAGREFEPTTSSVGNEVQWGAVMDS